MDQSLWHNLAIYSGLFFLAFLVIVYIRWRAKIAILGVRKFLTYIAIYAGIEAICLLVFFFALRWITQHNPAMWAFDPSGMAAILAAVIYSTVLIGLKSLPYIREILLILNEPSIAVKSN